MYVPLKILSMGLSIKQPSYTKLVAALLWVGHKGFVVDAIGSDVMIDVVRDEVASDVVTGIVDVVADAVTYTSMRQTPPQY